MIRDAVRVVRVATGEIEEIAPKESAAAKLGRKGNQSSTAS
jgi:hypothetical protein